MKLAFIFSLAQTELNAKELISYLVGMGGSGMLAGALIASYLGKWMWTKVHVEIMAMVSAERERERASLLDLVDKANKRADKFESLAWADRSMAQHAVAGVTAVAKTLDGARP